MDSQQILDEKDVVNESDDYIGKHQFLKRRDARNAALIRMGHEGIMMEKHMRQHKIVENTVKGLQEQAGYKTSHNEESSSGEEDMGVNIGNESKTETHYHYPQPPQDESDKSKSNNWIPASILAAGALTGAGLYFNEPPTPQPQQIIVEPQDPTIGADIGVGFDEPEPIENLQLVPLDKKEQQS